MKQPGEQPMSRYTKCPVCGEAFGLGTVMAAHFQGVHGAVVVGADYGGPLDKSTVAAVGIQGQTFHVLYVDEVVDKLGPAIWEQALIDTYAKQSPAMTFDDLVAALEKFEQEPIPRPGPDDPCQTCGAYWACEHKPAETSKMRRVDPDGTVHRAQDRSTEPFYGTAAWQSRNGRPFR